MARVLLIDDDHLMARIYARQFSDEGFRVEHAADGETGFQMIGKFQPDLVVLDLVLPKLNGVEVLKRIRADAVVRELPVLVLSNLFMGELVRQARQAGATQTLSKGEYTPQNLVELARQTVSREALERDEHRPAAPAAPAEAPQTPEQVRQTLVAAAHETAKTLRELGLRFLAVPSDGSRVIALYYKVRSLTATTGAAGLRRIAWLSAALEALINDLRDQPRHINPSSVSTVEEAVECLGKLLEEAEAGCEQSPPTSVALAVDNDPIIVRLEKAALARAGVHVTCVEDPLMALELLAANLYDIVLLDIEMPNLNGMELCAQLRAMPSHERTPVMFVTSVGEFEIRKQAGLIGANGLLAKPFLPLELVVKAITLVLLHQHAPRVQ